MLVACWQYGAGSTDTVALRQFVEQGMTAPASLLGSLPVPAEEASALPRYVFDAQVRVGCM